METPAGVSRAWPTPSGSSIYVEDAGKGPVVLAIHGLGGGAYFFRALAPALRDRYRLMAVDLPGTGRSTSIDPFSAETWVRDLHQLVRLASDDPVVVVGHSLGTILALRMYAADPGRIKGLVFVGGLPEVRTAVRERLEARDAAIRVGGLSGWGAKVAPGVFAPETLTRRPELVGLFERVFDSQPAEVYLRTLRVLLQTSATRVVGTVRVPCVAITGADDQYAPPDVVEAFVRQVPGAPTTVVLPSCGHLPFFESPEEFGRAVRDFLDRL